MFENDNQLKPKYRCFLSNDGNIINSIHNICKSVSKFLSLVELIHCFTLHRLEITILEIGDEGAHGSYLYLAYFH